MVAPGAASWRRLYLRARRIGVRDQLHRRPILVLAPHPDDESLGVGALLAARAMAGAVSHVAFLTDAAGSHVDVPGWSPARVGRARESEGRQALTALGVHARALSLGWIDAAPATAESALFRRSAARLTAYCRRHGVGAIVTTWSREPHCDHEAAAALGDAVARSCRIARLDYLVWGWTLADLDRQISGRRALSFDVRLGRSRQRRAIACHRSQLGGRIAGGGTRFRLPRAILALVARPHLILLSGEDRHAA